MDRIYFACGYFVTLFLASVAQAPWFGFEISPHIFDLLTLRIHILMCLCAAFVAAVSFGLTSFRSRRTLSAFSCIFLGFATALIGLGLIYGYRQLFSQTNLSVAAFAIVLPSLLAGAVPLRHGA